MRPIKSPSLIRPILPHLSFSLILPQSITAHDDKLLVQSVEFAAVNAGGVDIARSAPHTLLIQRDGLGTYLMAVFPLLPPFDTCFVFFLKVAVWFSSRKDGYQLLDLFTITGDLLRAFFQNFPLRL